ncbi:MAG: hypothetical protein ACOC78_03980 [Actinomycetota bacterium]
MPLIGELEGTRKEADRLFVFLDGLEFISVIEDYRGFLQPLLDFGRCRYYKNRLEEKSLLLERVGEAHAVFLDWSKLDAGALSECTELEIVS